MKQEFKIIGKCGSIKRKVIPVLVILVFILLIGYLYHSETTSHPAEGFVYVHDLIPDAEYDIRYYGNNNFLGRRVDGYEKPVAILTREAAYALKAVSDELEPQGYALKIFDAYRPQKAVDDFIRWAGDPEDIKMKAIYYPDYDKKDLFALGYIAEKSGHSRGSTVDLTLVDKKTGRELDMGSRYDLLGEISHHGTSLITAEQTANREILRQTMVKHGFRFYYREWWHYTLQQEAYPDQYFNFDVK
jgi:D-alanyl-D-alanine dipeptidase